MTARSLSAGAARAAFFLLLGLGNALNGAEPSASGPPRVLLAPYSGIITPVAAEFLSEALSRAERESFEALVFELDTPGGLDLSMRTMVKAILNAKVPVIVFVHPTGSRAASAGVFITMAAHVAAMAPGTNIGAAHPVSIPAFGAGGTKESDKQDKVLEDKAVNDAAAYLKSIAQKRKRNEAWAFEAVAKSTSIPAQDALALGVIDLVAPDLAGLLERLDGRTLADFERPLKTAGAELVRQEMTRRQRWLAAIANPNVAMILMSLGAGGLFIELYNPGLVFPGVVGAICLLLAFYSFETLSASYAGVLLLLSGFAFFVLEVKLAGFGLLALGGVIASVLGVLILFQQPLGGLSVSWSVLAGTLAGLLGLTAAAAYAAYRALGRPVATGADAMIGAEGKALGALAMSGKVLIHGEIWEADSLSGELGEGAEIVVVAVADLRLKVRAK